MEQPLVSVIIPVYNVAQYLCRCIDSVLNQSYENMEVILVDDGSTDGSSQICDRYLLNDDRIKVIHKENGGLSSARNAGLDICKGEYVAFVDSDDWIKASMYEDLMEVALKTDSDVTCCSFYYEYDSSDGFIEQEYQLPLEKENVLTVSSEDYLSDFSRYAQLFLIITVNKVYKATVFSSLRFSNGKRCEDEIIFHEILTASSRISVINKPLYCYYQSGESITRGKDNWVNECYQLEALRGRALFFQKTQYQVSSVQCTTEYLLSVVRTWKKLKVFDSVSAKEELKIFREMVKHGIGNLPISWETKFLIHLFCLFPDISNNLFLHFA